MIKIKMNGLKVIMALVLVSGLLFAFRPIPAFSQQQNPSSNIQNLIVNGGFEGGFQADFGIGYGWGGFSNGNAVVGWNFDEWDAVVAAGQYAQRIEIKEALDGDRYAGIYQTIAVIPGEQYKLTIKGVIRSEEGDVALSDYGYRLQYTIDDSGGTAWELIDEDAWQELPWDEQALYEPANGVYRLDTFETTVTAKSDRLTLFIRGWKKWLNNGSGIYNLDEISFVGPAPEGFQAPLVQAVSVDTVDQQPLDEIVAADASAQVSEHDGDISGEETQPETAPPPEPSPQTETPAQPDPAPQTDVSPQTETSSQTESQLPVSGRGGNNSNYVVIAGVVILLALFVAAITATTGRRNPVE